MSEILTLPDVNNGETRLRGCDWTDALGGITPTTGTVEIVSGPAKIATDMGLTGALYACTIDITGQGPIEMKFWIVTAVERISQVVTFRAD